MLTHPGPSPRLLSSSEVNKEDLPGCPWLCVNRHKLYFRIVSLQLSVVIQGGIQRSRVLRKILTHINILVVVGICQFQRRAWCCSGHRQTDRSTPVAGLEKKPSRLQGWRLHLLFPWPALTGRDSHSSLKADLSSFWESCLRREQGRQEAVNVKQGVFSEEQDF